MEKLIQKYKKKNIKIKILKENKNIFFNFIYK